MTNSKMGSEYDTKPIPKTLSEDEDLKPSVASSQRPKNWKRFSMQFKETEYDYLTAYAEENGMRLGNLMHVVIKQFKDRNPL